MDVGVQSCLVVSESAAFAIEWVDLLFLLILLLMGVRFCMQIQSYTDGKMVL